MTIKKNVLKYQQDGTCLNLNKTISGTRTMVSREDNIMQKKRKLHLRELKRFQNSGDLRRV